MHILIDPSTMPRQWEFRGTVLEGPGMAKDQLQDDNRRRAHWILAHLQATKFNDVRALIDTKV